MEKKINYSMNYKMYEEYVNYYYKHVSKYTKVRFASIIILLFASIFYFIRGVIFSDTLAIGLGVFILAVAIILCFAMYLMIKNENKKVWSSNKYLENGEMELTVTFFEDHFEQVNKIGTINFEYDKLFGTYETDNYFYLMIANRQGIIVPKSVCDDELLTFIKANIINLVSKSAR